MKTASLTLISVLHCATAFGFGFIPDAPKAPRELQYYCADAVLDCSFAAAATQSALAARVGARISNQ